MANHKNHCLYISKSVNFHLNKNTNKIYGKSTPRLEVEVTRNTTFVYIICP